MSTENFGLYISLLALGFSLFTYFRHDAKIKKQSRLINEYQIEKFKLEKEKSQKAVIKADVIDDTKGSVIFRFTNLGEATAKNFSVYVPDVKGIVNSTNPTPIDLRPENSLDITLFLTMAAPDFITFELEWKDEFKEKNHESYKMHVP